MVWTSLFGIITIILLARAMGFGKAPQLADVAEAQSIAGNALPGFRGKDAVLSDDRRAALVAGINGDIALVRPLGDRWVVRIVNGAAVQVKEGRMRLKLAEAMFPAADLLLGANAEAWAKKL